MSLKMHAIMLFLCVFIEIPFMHCIKQCFHVAGLFFLYAWINSASFDDQSAIWQTQMCKKEKKTHRSLVICFLLCMDHTLSNADDLVRRLSLFLFLKILHLSSYREYSLTELQSHSCSHDLTESLFKVKGQGPS